jgi:3-deoxy-manno-octulosonate cytidylyltransferase (CMP-KDO synthetase)
MSVIAITPARMGSTRFPGKPLAKICGTPMIGLVYKRTVESNLVERTYIATCDQEIKDYADSIRAPCIMTSDKHERCTDRTAEALLTVEKEAGEQVDTVVMVQGDEPMIRGVILDSAISLMQQDSSVRVVNLMSRIESEKEFLDSNEVKVVVDCNDNALYFSREPIPSRKKISSSFIRCKQLGVILFEREMLCQYNLMKPTPLEEVESVDMLRLLENNIPIKMAPTNSITFSVDTPEDLQVVIKHMRLQKKEVYSL